MHRSARHLLGACAVAALSSLAHGQTTVSLGLDYAEGKYGGTEKSTDWTVPVQVKYETGPLTLKLNIPYVRSTGTANREVGGNVRTDKVTQSGLGDVTASAAYTVYTDKTSGLGLDLGGKIKFATADDAKDLLTTGENDYSLQADVFRPFGDTTVFGTLGWTRKGDPDGTEFRNPWYASVGFSRKVSDATSWGLAYDWRAKVLENGDPISEATLFLSHKYTKQVKVQGYLIGGFSDASPDFGAGALVSYSY